MEHHIYLTFLSAIYAGEKFNRTSVEKTVINPELPAPFNIILQTSESALKYLLNIKNKETPGFTLEKNLFFHYIRSDPNKSCRPKQNYPQYI